MRFEHELRVRLRERRNRLYRCGYQLFDNEERLMLRWIEDEPYLAALLAEVDGASIDFAQWKAAGSVGWQQLDFPNDEQQRAKICLAILREHNPTQYGQSVSNESQFDDILRAYVEHFVDPLVAFLEDAIDDGSAVLGILERYKRRCEWFHQAQLHALYEADTARGEAAFDQHLREYLVDQGVSYPFSQPRSPSGQADVVVQGDDPLALEIKLFKPDAGKDRAYIRQGFAQAYRYAADFGVPAGYLVVFNLTADTLVFGNDHPGRWPSTITVQDRPVFCIVIDAHPDRPSASKDRTLKRVELDRQYLLDAGVAASSQHGAGS